MKPNLIAEQMIEYLSGRALRPSIKLEMFYGAHSLAEVQVFPGLLPPINSIIEVNLLGSTPRGSVNASLASELRKNIISKFVEQFVIRYGGEKGFSRSYDAHVFAFTDIIRLWNYPAFQAELHVRLK